MFSSSSSLLLSFSFYLFSLVHIHIAIIWASFAWLSTYLQLHKRLGKTAKITLIDERDHFTYIPSLHETLLDTKRLKKIQFDLSTYYQDDFMHAKVTQVSKEMLITTDTGKHIHPDYLVITTWSRTNMYDNTSFKQHTYTVRHPEDISVINTQLIQSKDICIIWGWVTWVEIASILSQRVRPDQHIHIVHSKQTFFQNFHDKVGQWTKDRLEKNNIHIYMWSRASQVTSDTVILTDGTQIPSNCTILSTGIKINDEAHSEQLTFAHEVCTNGYCALENERTFVAGDVAIHGLYTTAHNAMLEWRRIGNHIADQIQWVQKNYAPLENWKEVAIALGERDGILTNNHRWFYLPYLTGLAKKIIEKRVMFEFKYKVMLPV